MPRPPMPIGTYGSISVTEPSPGTFRARCRYRDFDGKVYPVERYGPSREQAVNRLKEAIRDWVAPAGAGEITSMTKLVDVGRAYLQELENDASQEFKRPRK